MKHEHKYCFLSFLHTLDDYSGSESYSADCQVQVLQDNSDIVYLKQSSLSSFFYLIPPFVSMVAFYQF